MIHLKPNYLHNKLSKLLLNISPMILASPMILLPAIASVPKTDLSSDFKIAQADNCPHLIAGSSSKSYSQIEACRQDDGSFKIFLSPRNGSKQLSLSATPVDTTLNAFTVNDNNTKYLFDFAQAEITTTKRIRVKPRIPFQNQYRLVKTVEKMNFVLMS